MKTTIRKSTVRAELDDARDRNRKLSGIITHWQKFAVQISTILNCSSIDDDIIVALKKLKKEVRTKTKAKARRAKRCHQKSTGR